MELLDSKRTGSAKKQSEAAFAIVGSLREGRLLIAPIEQGYVFVADPNSDEAISKLKRIRNLSEDIYFPLIVSQVEQITPHCGTVSPEQRLLAIEFWPGQLIMECRTMPGEILTFGSKFVPDSLFFRSAANKLLAQICDLAGALIYTPVLIDGKIATTHKSISSEITDECGFLIVGKDFTPEKLPTIVTFEDRKVCLSRLGDISESKIRKLIPNLQAN